MAAKRLGVSVESGCKGYTSPYTSRAVDAEVIFSYDGGDAVAVRTNKGYELMIDNWHNPITSKLGRDCTTLGREYTRTLVEQQAAGMGGLVTHNQIMQDGSVQMQISI
jgi:hypothetical protein